MTLKKIAQLGAAAAALVFTTQTNAADLYGGFKGGPAAFSPPMWTGFYLGANGGYAWRQTDDQFGYPACAADCRGVRTWPTFPGIGAEGGFGGGQIGYNWQGVSGMSSLVAGIEADIQGAGISGKAITVPGEPFKNSLDWFGTVRGRIGYAASSALVYVTGGFAYGGLRQNGEDNSWPTPAFYESNGTVTGYVLGGGVEYKFNPSWSLKAEYQYLNFGKNDPALVSGPASAPATVAGDGNTVKDDAFHTVRFGVNYWVRPAYEPLK
jgi:outer membrane immunogenic protein